MLKKNKALILTGGGIALILFGLARGEFQEVLFKGIVICLECMGLGTP